MVYWKKKGLITLLYITTKINAWIRGTDYSPETKSLAE